MRGVTAMSSGTSCCARIAATATRFTALGAELYAFHRKRSKAKRKAEARGELFELHDAARFGLLMDTVERRDAKIFKPDGDALVGGEHEFLDEAVGPGALGAGDAAHLALLVELDDRLGKVEVDGAALFAALVHENGEALHALEFWDEVRSDAPVFRHLLLKIAWTSV